MSSDFDHDGCAKSVKVTRYRLVDPTAKPVNNVMQTEQVIFDGRANVSTLDRSYHWLQEHMMLEICDGFYNDGSAKHKQVEMEGGRVSLTTGGMSVIEGFVQGVGGEDDDYKRPDYYKERWFLDV